MILYANDKLDLTSELITRIQTKLPARETQATREFEGKSGSTGSGSTGGREGEGNRRDIPPPPQGGTDRPPSGKSR